LISKIFFTLEDENMIRYHSANNEITLAEILPGTDMINNPQDMLDLMAEAGYNGSRGVIIHSASLHPDFFDLKSKLAGEILQKFSNYRMRLAIIGDFTGYTSKSLHDFIRESNKRGIICFVDSLQKAIDMLER